MQKCLLLAAATALTALSVHLGDGAALAQGISKGPGKPTLSASPQPRSAASLECSYQADARGLHGKARKHFRSKCIRSMTQTGKSPMQKGFGYRGAPQGQ